MLKMKQQKPNKLCAYIHNIKLLREGTACYDLTGQYSIQYLQENNYIIIIYHYNSNVILTESIKT